MQGDAEIIEVLNEVLTAELTAVNQYFLHGKLCGNWGYDRLAEHSRNESIDEMKHAERITDRIIYLDGFPNYQRYFPLRIGETVPEQFEADLALEVEAIDRLNRGIELAVAKSDNGTASCSPTSSSARRSTSTGSRRSSRRFARSGSRTTSRSSCTATDGPVR